jgi:hypothetical protein
MEGHNYTYTYNYTNLYLNHASLNSRWKASLHEGREITYLQCLKLNGFVDGNYWVEIYLHLLDLTRTVM